MHQRLDPKRFTERTSDCTRDVILEREEIFDVERTIEML